tara:strand:+ start:2055 stop:3038 length:984 start_codon:yes stop_codon:yes gene_type:complete
MIITRSPLRISLGGGGTDLKSYYKNHSGFLIAGAINKYVYINFHQSFNDKIILKYSQIEEVENVNEIAHPIIRETLKLFSINNTNIEIASMADIPSGTGLGSSGSFTTALIKACHLYKKNISYPEIIAKEACNVEIDILKEPIGKQDQYISSYGGLSCFDFNKDGSVLVTPLKISKDSILNLEENLLLFFTGFSRSASKILKSQVTQSEKNENSIIENLHEVKEMGYQSKKYLENGDLNSFANLMNDHWQIKKKRSKTMTNKKIDSYYQSGIDNGAIGGKVIGAGGGGFLMFYASDKKLLRNKMQSLGLIEINFQFEFEGTKSIVSI